MSKVSTFKLTKQKELHAHLNGSIRDSTIAELCAQKNIPRVVNSESNRDLKRFFFISLLFIIVYCFLFVLLVLIYI